MKWYLVQEEKDLVLNVEALDSGALGVSIISGGRRLPSSVTRYDSKQAAIAAFEAELQDYLKKGFELKTPPEE